MKFFEDSNALDSLRHSDFDSLSAYGEVIDNSLQAEATKIKVKIFSTPPKNGYEQIEHLAFGDNGVGMPVDTVHACLKLGWSSRYNDRTGIGRFGVGMVLGAIHEVKRIEVFTKQVGGDWFYTYVDLDEIEAGNLEEIPDPVIKQIPDKFLDLVGENQGTLVVWSKYDKQVKSAHLILNEAKHWIGRTFRYFIWDGVEILLNSEEVKAHDPLYARTENTNYPNDPSAELHQDITFDWPISRSSGYNGSEENSLITIKMSTLPEEFRPKRGSGNSKSNTDRFVHENEGISILRNRREVFYGKLPYWTSVKLGNSNNRTWRFEEKDRWWGCEILFNAELDSDFSVRNIKRGAEPLPELKKLIKKQITPTRNTALEQVDQVWKTYDDEQKKDDNNNDSKLGRGKHTGAEKVVKNTKVPKSNVSLGQSAEDIAENALFDKDENQRAAIIALFKAQPFTINESRWKGETFLESYHSGDKVLLDYNNNHSFFNKYFSLIEQLESEHSNPVNIANDLRILIDLLLISSVKAQSLLDGERNIETVDDLLEELNNSWGKMLSNYVKNWDKEKDT